MVIKNVTAVKVRYCVTCGMPFNVGQPHPECKKARQAARSAAYRRFVANGYNPFPKAK